MTFSTRLLSSLATFLMATLASAPALATETFSGKVVKLSDGDTLQFLADGETRPFKVRMIAIDTAEMHLGVPGGIVTQGYWADMGADQLAKYISIGDVTKLEVFGEDKYKRKLGRIFKNGEDINLKMLASGWASLYVLCDSGTTCRTGALSEKDLKAYRAACETSVKDGLGLFDPARPVPELPFVFRAREQKQNLSKFVADLSKNTYTQPDQYESVSICNRLFYLSEKDAIKNGFTTQ